jgi:transposase
MWNIGIDAHKRRCELTAKDGDGKLVRRKNFAHTPEGWRDALRDAPAGSRVAVECVGWYQPIFDLLDELGMNGILVHAKDVTLIARSKKKTDRRDSEVLVDLLRSGFLPTAHVPSRPTRELRELTRHRDDIVKQATATKNRVHRLLERAWIQLPEVTDLFGDAGRRFLDNVHVSQAQHLVLVALLRELDCLNDLRGTLDAQIAAAVQHDADVQLLLGIDGLSVIGAATLRAEFDDVMRFPNRATIRSNFGLATSVRDSADTQRRGHITKQGPGVVRKILVQGALHFKRNNPNAERKHTRLSEARGAGIARVAAGADLLDTAYQVLKTRTPYYYADAARQKRKNAELRTMAAAAQRLSVS